MKLKKVEGMLYWRMGWSAGEVMYSAYDTASALMSSPKLLKTCTSSTQPGYGIWGQSDMFTRPYSLLES